jgi:archaellum component FlaC
MGGDKMEQLLKHMMEQMNQNFNKIDQRFTAIDKRFDKIELRLDGTDQRFDAMDQEFIGVNHRLDKVKASIHSLEKTVKNNASEFRSYFRHIDNDKMFEMLSAEV